MSEPLTAEARAVLRKHAKLQGSDTQWERVLRLLDEVVTLTTERDEARELAAGIQTQYERAVSAERSHHTGGCLTCAATVEERDAALADVAKLNRWWTWTDHLERQRVDRAVDAGLDDWFKTGHGSDEDS